MNLINEALEMLEQQSELSTTMLKSLNSISDIIYSDVPDAIKLNRIKMHVDFATTQVDIILNPQPVFTKQNGGIILDRDTECEDITTDLKQND